MVPKSAKSLLTHQVSVISLSFSLAYTFELIIISFS